MNIQHNHIDFEKLKIRTFELKPLTKTGKRPVNGLDTETYQGYAKLIADSSQRYKIIDSIDDVLSFLTSKRFRHCHNFFYNIRYDFQAVVKWLPEANLKELYFDGSTIYEDYAIRYIPKKLFRVIKSKHSCSFYDLAIFYEMSLERAAKEYLGEQKNVDNLDRDRINTDYRYWHQHWHDIIRYCISDATLTKQLGDFLQHEFQAKMYFLPQKYISKASVSKEYFRKHCNIPSIKDIPKGALSYAFNAYRGGRFEVLRKGYFKEATLIDINSAYPYQISQLKDFSGGRWHKVHDVDYDALYGFYICKVEMPFMDCAPIAYRNKFHIEYYPCGKFALFLTKNEIESYRKYGDIQVVNGWECKKKDAEQPFKAEVEKLYHLKQVTPKDDFRYDLVKKILNSLYGSFYEKVIEGDTYKTGKLFNPVYATEITANTRIHLYNEAQQHLKQVIGFATDSVLIEGNRAIDEDTALGKWSIDKSGETIVLRSGMYKIAQSLKSRGVSRNTKINTEEGKYENIFDYMHTYPKRQRYKILIERPVNLGEAIRHSQTMSVRDINIWRSFPYVVDINKDYKRLWCDTFKGGGEMFERCIDSSPVVLGGMW